MRRLNCRLFLLVLLQILLCSCLNYTSPFFNKQSENSKNEKQSDNDQSDNELSSNNQSEPSIELEAPNHSSDLDLEDYYGYDYQKATKDGEFEIAHKILSSDYSDDAMVYINYQEIASLLEEGKTSAYREVLFVLNDIQTQGYCEEGPCDYQFASDVENHNFTGYHEKGINDYVNDLFNRNDDYFDKAQVANNYGNKIEQTVTFINFCKKYNELCDKALDLAISKKDRRVANVIVESYKPEVVIKKEKHWFSSNTGRIIFTYKAKAKAEKKVKSAFNSSTSNTKKKSKKKASKRSKKRKKVNSKR